MSTSITGTINHLPKSVSTDLMIQIQFQPTQQEKMGCQAGQCSKTSTRKVFYCDNITRMVTKANEALFLNDKPACWTQSQYFLISGRRPTRVTFNESTFSQQIQFYNNNSEKWAVGDIYNYNCKHSALLLYCRHSFS